MSDARRRRGRAPALLAALVAACGVLSARAEEPMTLDLAAGTNYEVAVVTPVGSELYPGSTLTFVLSDPTAGTSISRHQALGETPRYFPGMTAGAYVAVDGYLIGSDDVTTNSAVHDLLLMARAHDDGWIHETADTFEHGSGTGTWTGRDLATVSGDEIAIDTTDGSSSTSAVACAVGSVPGSNRGFTLATVATFPDVCGALPDPGDQRLGLTIGLPPDDPSAEYSFLYVENGSWTAAPLAVCDPSRAKTWQIRIAVDTSVQTATYYVRAADDEPWTILGTAQNVGSASVTQASFQGKGSIRGLDGNGFDTQLVSVQVLLGEESLRPGINFEEMVVTGRVVSTVIHGTDRTGGSFTVRLTDLEGNVIETEDYTYTAEGEVEFYVRAEDLTPGAAYRSEIVFDTEAEINDSDLSRTMVMGRAITNADWSVTNKWIRENARTFDRLEAGTGDWRNGEYTETEGEWIAVGALLGERESPESPLSFTPTNAVTENSSCYAAGIRAIFPEVTANLDDADGVFGLTVSETDEGLSFMCISNRTWQAVPRSVAVPVLGSEYTLDVYVQRDERILEYVVTDGDGEQFYLMRVALESDLAKRVFSRVDVIGIGRVTDLLGDVYSTDLIRLHVDFSDDTMYPGTNFEATVANGVIHFEKLWETDRTNGILRVIVRDKYGSVVGQRRISFHDLADRDFDYYVKNLTPGENYTVEVEAEVKGEGIDDSSASDSASGIMARVVTNELWATEEWIREDVDTFAGRELGTGVWDYETGSALEADGYISVNTMVAEASDACVGFLATNALPHHTGFEIRSKLCFDTACTETPTVTGKYGMTIIDADPSGTAAVQTYQFLVLTNGAWASIATAVYEPQVGVEYEMTVRADYKRHLACYMVQSSDDEWPVVVMEYDLPENESETPYETEYYGVGRVRTHEGDGLDVSVVEIDPDFDEFAFVPGTNFEATVVSGTLRIRRIWLTDKEFGSVTVYVRDADGNLVSSGSFSYAELADHDFRVPIEGLTAGEVYDIEVVTDLEGDEVSKTTVTAVMARTLGGWICEDAETFLGERTGTGFWTETNEVTRVVDTTQGRAIRFDSVEISTPVRFAPTNDTLSIRKSTVREIRYDLDFEVPGWSASEAAPQLPPGTLAGLTVWCDDEDVSETDPEQAIAVVTSNETWIVLDETRGKYPASGSYEVHMLIDFQNGLVRYEIANGSATNRLYQYGFEPRAVPDLKLAIAGTGNIRAIDGDAWDPNLIASSDDEFSDPDDEFPDLESAIRATIGRDKTLSPLWLADQYVTFERGSFRIYDPNDWLTIRFPWWYYVEISPDGDGKIYKFNQSNNWIDYAEDGDENVVTNGGFYLVKTAEGLSWIAALATNEWVSGRIELANDIDLTKHNWTPIAGFSGLFDGKGQTITGLNNTNHNYGIPGGEYVCGPTNAWGRTAYGLFGTATNATLTGVTFAGVAISNLADSVAALAGALAGNCAVSNVTVDSGTVFGLGGSVAGVAGFADFADFLTVVSSTNRALVAADAELYGARRTAAGILCVAGPTDPAAPLGTVVVTNNVNYGVVSNAIYDTDLFGGNVAQILAGAVPGARFGDVHLTNNLAAGSVDAFLVRSPENALDVTNFPAVNLAASIWGFDDEMTFWRALDANVPGAVAVDPYRRTARMLSGMFPNGTVNDGGVVNDRISALPAGSLVTLEAGFDSWGPVVLDRDITVDLNSETIFTVYVNNTFVISNGVTATVRNGTIAVGPESEAFVGDTSHLTQENLVIEDVGEEFYERTTVSVNGEPISALYSTLLSEVINSSGTVIELYEDAGVEIDVDAGELRVNGKVVAKLTDCYGFKVATDDDGNAIGFQVKIVDSAAPTAEFTMTGGEAGTVSVTVGNAKEGFWYVLQHKDSLAAEWVTPPAEEWVRADANGAVLESSSDGNQGYYRILMSDVPGGGDSDGE